MIRYHNPKRRQTFVPMITCNQEKDILSLYQLMLWNGLALCGVVERYRPLCYLCVYTTGRALCTCQDISSRRQCSNNVPTYV